MSAEFIVGPGGTSRENAAGEGGEDIVRTERGGAGSAAEYASFVGGVFDLLIGGLADSVGAYAMAYGDALDAPVVDYMGSKIEITVQDPDSRAEDRLETIMAAAREVSSSIEGGDPGDLAVLLLEADGWTKTRLTLRTPLWMKDVQEWPLKAVLRAYEELKCLEA